MQDSDQERVMEPMEDTSMQIVDESPQMDPVDSANEHDMAIEKEDENKKGGEQSGPSSMKDSLKVTTESAAEPQEPEDEDAPLDLMKMREFEFSQVSNLTPAQLRRYEQYRRSDLKSMKVRKVLTALNPMMQKASDQYVIAIKGLSKLFVGDVVETALEVRKERGETGALTPRQIREAYRRLRRAGAVPTTSNWSDGSLW
ncbi:Histone-fold protein [Gracilaria domingensis]|nr:Histone-fold protein [Gracilaria domingensis]